MDFMGTKSATFKKISKKKIVIAIIDEVIDLSRTAHSGQHPLFSLLQLRNLAIHQS